MRTAIIGATGHIGTWFVPRLVNEGREVVAVSRWRRRPTASPAPLHAP